MAMKIISVTLINNYDNYNMKNNSNSKRNNSKQVMILNFDKAAEQFSCAESERDCFDCGITKFC